MKTFSRISLALLAVVMLVSCDAFHTLTRSRLKTAQGRPYELIVVCPQQQWTGVVGDSLRAILSAPVPVLNQDEPLFDVLRVTERGFSGMIADHRNILKVLVEPSLSQASVAVQYDVTAEPQIVMTLQGPSDKAIVDYLSQHRVELVQGFEKAERDRASRYSAVYNQPDIEQAAKRIFGVEVSVPKGYVLANEQKDFLWARFEYPSASQGFFMYSYPAGEDALSPAALLAARNKYAALIPGPSDNSHMTTADVIEPYFRMFRLEGRLWCEMRGFWDVEGDYMGGPFVSYSTIDTATGYVFTLDCYVFSPKLPKRNFLRGVEHLLYSIKFPELKQQ